jgi:hypothetical protein
MTYTRLITRFLARLRVKRGIYLSVIFVCVVLNRLVIK